MRLLPFHVAQVGTCRFDLRWIHAKHLRAASAASLLDQVRFELVFICAPTLRLFGGDGSRCHLFHHRTPRPTRLHALVHVVAATNFVHVWCGLENVQARFRYVIACFASLWHGAGTDAPNARIVAQMDGLWLGSGPFDGLHDVASLHAVVVQRASM